MSQAAEPPPRILLVRLSAIGDIVFATPLIQALRAAHPQAHLVWLAQPEYRELLAQHPELDAVIDCPIGEWRALWRAGRFRELWQALLAMRETLRAERFDQAIDLQGLFKSGLLTWFTGAPERIGLGSREGSQWLMTRVLARGGEPERIGSEYRYLAEQLGLPLDAFAMHAPVTAKAANLTSQLIEAHQLQPGYAALCPFTTRPQKHWPKRHWTALADALHAELGLIPVLLGGPNDAEAAAQIAEHCTAPVVNLAGQTGLAEAVALIDRAALVIAVDTGLGHIGIARARPSLLLFGSTCPYRDTGRADARVLYHPRPCSPCKRNPTCGGTFECMSDITPAEALAAARELLAPEPMPEPNAAPNAEPAHG